MLNLVVGNHLLEVLKDREDLKHDFCGDYFEICWTQRVITGTVTFKYHSYSIVLDNECATFTGGRQSWAQRTYGTFYYSDRSFLDKLMAAIQGIYCGIA